MRTRLVVAGLAAGVAATLAPLSPASAQCTYTIEGVEDCGSCTDGIELVDQATADVRAKLGVGDLSDQFVCTQ